MAGTVERRGWEGGRERGGGEGVVEGGREREGGLLELSERFDQTDRQYRQMTDRRIETDTGS